MHVTERGAACLEFGRFRLFTRQRELRIGDATVPLGSRAFDVLLILVEAEGDLVTKEELLARVWPGAVVEESNIQVQVSALRKALGDDRNLILTVPLRAIASRAKCVRSTATAVRCGGGSRAPDRAAGCDQSAGAGVGFHRARDRARELRELLRHNRLVTLVGTGGIGKTRLGLEAARATLEEFPDGVWLAELAPLTEPDLVASAVNTALGLQSGAGRWTSERLAAALRGRRLLLVLDNCEHLIGAAAREAETLLRAVPGACILATSQEPLGLDGECTYRLRPLEFPAEETAELAAALRHDAVRLFVARARAADPHFNLSERNAATVATICRRLDGIPLAIELAAARAAALGIEGLARRLDLRFHVLTGGRRTALPRHQTLRATLDWSHRLLAEPDRIVLRRLAVFAGSFSLEAAASVVADPALAEWEVIGRIAELVDKSLVVADAAGPVRRYRLLETTHAYAMEKLADSGEFGSLARLHALHFRDHVRSALALWEETPSVQWLEAQAPEIDNIRIALDWTFGADGDTALGIELAAASYVLWYLLSLMQEGRARLERATAAFDPATPQKVEAQLWYGYGFLSTGEPRGRAVPALRRAVSLYRESGEPLDLGRVLSFYGLNLARAGQLTEGLAALEEARRQLSAAAHPKSLALCLTNLAIARTVAGEFKVARALLDEALAVGRTLQGGLLGLACAHLQGRGRIRRGTSGGGDHAGARGRGARPRRAAHGHARTRALQSRRLPHCHRRPRGGRSGTARGAAAGAGERARCGAARRRPAAPRRHRRPGKSPRARRAAHRLRARLLLRGVRGTQSGQAANPGAHRREPAPRHARGTPDGTHGDGRRVDGGRGDVHCARRREAHQAHHNLRSGSKPIAAI